MVSQILSMDGLLAQMCDERGCQAQFYVVTEFPKGGSLQWCAHHYDSHKAALEAVGARVITDNRHELNKVAV